MAKKPMKSKDKPTGMKCKGCGKVHKGKCPTK